MSGIQKVIENEVTRIIICESCVMPVATQVNGRPFDRQIVEFQIANHTMDHSGMGVDHRFSTYHRRDNRVSEGIVLRRYNSWLMIK